MKTGISTETAWKGSRVWSCYGSKTRQDWSILVSVKISEASPRTHLIFTLLESSYHPLLAVY